MKTIEQIIKEKIAPHLKELRKRSKKESWKNGMPFFDHNFEQMKFENGFALIPLEIIRDPKTNVNDIAVYADLSLHAGTKDICCPSDETIADHLKRCVSIVIKSRKKLKELGYIHWRNTGWLNVYLLLADNVDPEKRKEYFERFGNIHLLHRSLQRKGEKPIEF